MAATSDVTTASLRARLLQGLAFARPTTPESLWRFVRAFYDLAVPRRAVCPGHAAPMDYLAHAILWPGRDLVVWACRGGAKTELGSVATHLDSILRPGCQTRILGGSLDQSQKMYAYLLRKWVGPFAPLLVRRPTARRTDLANGSRIEILTQSARSIRGQRVHRLKCDEVDEFSPEVWRAAQFVTQSSAGRDGVWIPAQMEVFSTMHRPFGPMARLVDRLSEQNQCGANDPTHEAGDAVVHSALRAPHSAFPLLLKWCLWEVIEPCPPERSCSRCPLWSDCEGRARGADGYFPIDDAIAQKSRASREAWESEMLCLRPRADDLVFGEFSPAHHVAPVPYAPDLPLYRAIDFGYANPFVCLWVQVRGQAGARGTVGSSSRGYDAGGARGSGAEWQGILTPRGGGDVDLSGVEVRVIGEYVARERAVAAHAHEMARRDPGPVLATWADPAGWQRSDVTGTGPCQELGRMGIRVRTPHCGIIEGVELVRRLLKPRSGGRPGLVIDPSCRWLIRALQEYHWDSGPDGRRSERPAKDGADHPIDALRYMLTGVLLGRQQVRERSW